VSVDAGLLAPDRIACILWALSPPCKGARCRICAATATAKDDPKSSEMGNAIGEAETTRADGAANMVASRRCTIDCIRNGFPVIWVACKALYKGSL
jgi:hypothetical protein